jgi:hypothetical protein
MALSLTPSLAAWRQRIGPTPGVKGRRGVMAREIFSETETVIRLRRKTVTGGRRKLR